MKKRLFAVSALLFLTTLASADDKGTKPVAPQCIEEKISLEKLKQQNAELMSQVLQLQFQVSQTAKAAAKTEQERLEKLLPPPVPEKK